MPLRSEHSSINTVSSVITRRLKTAGLELDKMDTAHVADHAEKWEMVVRKLRSGMMPPAGMPQAGLEHLRIDGRMAGRRTG